MKPKVLSTKLLHSEFFELHQDILIRHDGKTHPYHKVIIGANAVVVLAQDTQGRWILNREYRHPTGEVLLGTCAGRLEKNEDPIEGAQRELFEETGYWSDEVQLLGSCFPLPGVCDQKMFYLFAKNCVKKGTQHLEPFEFIDIELKTDEELKKAIRDSSRVDGNLCIALWYKEQLC